MPQWLHHHQNKVAKLFSVRQWRGWQLRVTCCEIQCYSFPSFSVPLGGMLPCPPSAEPELSLAKQMCGKCCELMRCRGFRAYVFCHASLLIPDSYGSITLSSKGNKRNRELTKHEKNKHASYKLMGFMCFLCIITYSDGYTLSTKDFTSKMGDGISSQRWEM